MFCRMILTECKDTRERETDVELNSVMRVQNGAKEKLEFGVCNRNMVEFLLGSCTRTGLLIRGHPDVTCNM